MREVPMDVARAIFGDRQEPKVTQPDILCRHLLDLFDRYTSPCPFKPGDLISPRKNSMIPGGGTPGIVLEVYDPPIVNTNTTRLKPGNPEYGARADVRIAFEIGESIVALAVESWMLEPYVGPEIGPKTAAN